MRITTGRLIIEPFSLALMDAALAGDSAGIAALGYGNSGGWPEKDLLEAMPVFRELLIKEGPTGFNSWLILDKGSMAILGSAGFVGGPAADGAVELGFGILPAWRRKGYCREAVRALMDWAIKAPGVKSIKARCEPGNLPSRTIIKELGFIETGLEDGLMVWAFLKP